MSRRRIPVEKIRWTTAEKVNASVWAVEWGVTIFCVVSAFAGIVVTRTTPLYVFLPTVLGAVALSALSMSLKGKLRAIFRTEERVDKTPTGRIRIRELYGEPTYFVGSSDETRPFRPIRKELTHS